MLQAYTWMQVRAASMRKRFALRTEDGGVAAEYAILITLIALVIVAVPLKYLADIPGPTKVLGITHGWLYFLFFLTAVDLALRAKWSVKGTVLTILAGTIPFLSFVEERTTTRKTRAGEPI